jgi:hypothetical protein
MNTIHPDIKAVMEKNAAFGAGTLKSLLSKGKGWLETGRAGRSAAMDAWKGIPAERPVRGIYDFARTWGDNSGSFWREKILGIKPAPGEIRAAPHLDEFARTQKGIIPGADVDPMTDMGMKAALAALGTGGVLAAKHLLKKPTFAQTLSQRPELMALLAGGTGYALGK